MSSTFHALLVGLEDEHERELTDLRRKYDQRIKTLQERVDAKILPREASPIAADCEDCNNYNGANKPGQRSSVASENSVSSPTNAKLDVADAWLQDCGSIPIGRKISAGVKSWKSGTESCNSARVNVESSLLTSHIQKRLNKGSHKRAPFGGALSAALMKTRSVDSDFFLNGSANCISRLVHNAYFDSVCAVMITLNAAFLGISTRYDEPQADPSDPPETEPFIYDLADNIFSAWFITEIILRMRAEGLVRFFCFSRNLKWNLFDCIVVGSDVFAICIRIFWGDNMQVLGNLTIMRLLRVLRVARALRVVRLVTFFSELRMMVLSIMKSGMALFWSLVLLCMIIFIFGIFLMQSVSQHLEEQDDTAHRSDLIRWFGTLPRVGFTLFLCVTNGVSWVQIADLLSDIHWTNTLVLSFFIFFTIFAMLNIITGIFVETAISAVQNDKDEVIKGERNSETSLIRRLEHIFNKADGLGSGAINIRQFESIMAIDDTRILMKTMGLEVNEARNMFNIMDTDRSGEVNIEEFLVGCMRMKGAAKSIDLIALSYENRKLIEMIEDEMDHHRKFRSGVEAGLASLKSAMKHSHARANISNGEDEKVTTPCLLRAGTGNSNSTKVTTTSEKEIIII